MLSVARFKIEDRSMEPTLKPGDYVIVNKLPYFFGKPSKGDIIVFKHPKIKNKFLVKRIIRVASNKYFVIGDNKTQSTDSRRFGPIAKDLIAGKMFIHIKK